MTRAQASIGVDRAVARARATTRTPRCARAAFASRSDDAPCVVDDEDAEAKRIKQRAHRKRNRARCRTRANERVDALLEKFRALRPLERANDDGSWETVYAEEEEDRDDGVDWDGLPPGADPFGTNKKGGRERGMRKRNQVMTFVKHLRALLSLRGRREIKRCVDFGCGTGNVLMTCAATFPEIDFVGVDLNATSIEILNSRIRKSGLTNVSAVVGLIEDGDTFGADCALALHVCGSATDRVLNSAVRARIPFVIAPCCVGKVQEGGMRSLNRMRNDLISLDKIEDIDRMRNDLISLDKIEDIERPRSRLMRAAGFDFEAYMSAATLADWSGHQGVDPSDPNEPLAALPRRAKSAIEADRGEFAREHAYDVTLHKMPAQSGIRDDVLVGIPL